jgi:hypothetical protein
MPLVLNGIQNTTSGSGSLIAITRKPVKLNYIEGERLSLNGMQITFYSANKAPIVVEDYITIPAKDTILSRSDSQVVIQYRSNDGEYFQTVLPINIKYPVNIEVKNLPNRSYKKADNINLKGLKIDLIYNDNSRSLVDNTKITSYPADGTPLGNNTSLLFTYNDEDVRLDCFYELGGKNSNDIDETKITTFASGTWEQIKAMLAEARLGKFDMKDYWKVGDERESTANKGSLFNNDTLVVLDFSSRLNNYDGVNHVIIGNKTINKLYDINYSNMSTSASRSYTLGFNIQMYLRQYANGIEDAINADKTLQDTVLKITNVAPSRCFIAMVTTNDCPTTVSTSTVEQLSLNGRSTIILKKDDVIGDNAFEYYKTSSNRIKNRNNQPIEYWLDDINTAYSYNYYTFNISAYMGIVYCSTNGSKPGISAGYINKSGEYATEGISYQDHAANRSSSSFGFAYYFAIG